MSVARGRGLTRQQLASPVVLAYLLIVVVALVDALRPFHAALAEIFNAAPCPAAAGGTRRQVLWVGAAGLGAGMALALGSGVVRTEDYAITVVAQFVATPVAVLVSAFPPRTTSTGSPTWPAGRRP
ncbi:hypothetical protein BH10ACT10_BH10ACT10_19510 [soil metagenome]